MKRIENKRIELQTKLRNIKNEKFYIIKYNLCFYRNLIQIFQKQIIIIKLKDTVNNTELDAVKEELANLNKYSLKTDRLFFNSVRDVETGRINYIVNKLPDIVKKELNKKNN